jgi:hypothetical protein
MICKEKAVICFKALSQNLPERNEEYHKEPIRLIDLQDEI